MNENNGIIRNASVLGVPKMLLLGLQHMFAMFGATILVPILVNSYFGEDVLHVQVTLICAGVGTLLFHFCSKGKVPAFLGSSFAFLGGFATISDKGKQPVCGGIADSGACQTQTDTDDNRACYNRGKKTHNLFYTD